jgi:GxxExxY protein
MQDVELLHGELTGKILHSFYHVYNGLGYGFLESVYENALANTLLEHAVETTRQMPIRVCFERKLVGRFRADILVANCVIVEVKSLPTISPRDQAQLLNYLKATDIEVGLLLNFGEAPEFQRLVLTNDRKTVSLPENLKSGHVRT